MRNLDQQPGTAISDAPRSAAPSSGVPPAENSLVERKGSSLSSWFTGLGGALVLLSAAFSPRSEAASVTVSWDKYTDLPNNTTIKVAAGTAANRPNFGFRVVPATLTNLTFTGLPNGKGTFFAAQAYRTANPTAASDWTRWIYTVTPAAASGIKKTSLAPAPTNSPLPVVATFAYSAQSSAVFNISDLARSAAPGSLGTAPIPEFPSAPRADAGDGLHDYDFATEAIRQAMSGIDSSLRAAPVQAMVQLSAPPQDENSGPRFMARSEELPQVATPPPYSDLASLGFAPPAEAVGTFAGAWLPSQRLIRNPGPADGKVTIVNFERPAGHIAHLTIHFPRSQIGNSFSVEATTNLREGQWFLVGEGNILVHELFMQVPVAEIGENPKQMVFRVRVGEPLPTLEN